MNSVERKLFETDGVRGKSGLYPITEIFAEDLGRAIGMFLDRNSKYPKVLVGRDTRISGSTLESALARGLTAAGASVELLGIIPTPALAHALQNSSAVGGVIISASHNLFQDNGFKLFDKDGGKISPEIEGVLEEMLSKKRNRDSFPKPNATVKHRSDWKTQYKDMCKAYAESVSALKGLKVVVDCAHGSNFHVAPSILRSCGLEVEEIGCDPSGYNINLSVGSTNPNNLREAVKNANANIGVAFDGDGDRLIMVDEVGKILDGDDILFVLANYYLSSNRSLGGVVGTLMTNLGLERSIVDLGLGFERVGVGDRFVMEKLKERDWALGGETSGHIICRDIATSGDGLLACLQILSGMSTSNRQLSELRSGLIKFPQVLINVGVSEKLKVLREAELKEAVDQAKHSLGESGRILVRASGTESLIRVMVEGRNRDQINVVATDVVKTIEEINAKIS